MTSQNRSSCGESTTKHLFVVCRPVLVPPCTVMPFRSRATMLTSTPCQFSICVVKLLGSGESERPQARVGLGQQRFRLQILDQAQIGQHGLAVGRTE